MLDGFVRSRGRHLKRRMSSYWAGAERARLWSIVEGRRGSLVGILTTHPPPPPVLTSLPPVPASVSQCLTNPCKPLAGSRLGTPAPPHPTTQTQVNFSTCFSRLGSHELTKSATVYALTKSWILRSCEHWFFLGFVSSNSTMPVGTSSSRSIFQCPV